MFPVIQIPDLPGDGNDFDTSISRGFPKCAVRNWYWHLMLTFFTIRFRFVIPSGYVPDVYPIVITLYEDENC